MERCDGIILGAGHNALVLQAYLCRMGLKVLALERASQPGGGLNTIENPRVPGCLHNLHSFFHRAVTQMRWYRDLELESYGARYVEPDLNVALVTSEGRTLEWWRDFELTVESFAAFSRRDADRLRDWRDRFRPIVDQILIPEAHCPPMDPERRRQLLERSSLGRLLLDTASLSPLEFVRREFEHETVQAGLLFFNGLREVDLRLKGFGHSIPALLASSGKAQMCLGGSARLAEALVRVIEAHGGQVRCGVSPRRIVTKRGRAVGVECSNGETFEGAGFIVSSLNPQQTFVELLAPSPDTRALRERAARYEYNLIAPLMGLHLVLREAPHWLASRQRPELNQAFMTILGLDRLSQFPDLVESHEKGQLPDPIAWGAVPSRFDPSQGGGYHTAFLWEKVPYHLRGDADHWDEIGAERGNRLLALWRRFAPNLDEGNIVDQFVVTPRDTVRALPNMRDGDLLVGSFAHGQVGRHRPFYEAGRYRTPLEGLYLCGGATHPGGNITGLPGYNAALVIANDLHRNPWWESDDLEARWASLPA